MPEDYPNYNVLERKGYWDEHTREIIERRISDVPELKFFNSYEAKTLKAALDRVLPQDREKKIPIIPFIDEKLAKNRTDGTRYEEMPGMQDLWRMFIKALDEEAKAGKNKRFTELGKKAKDMVLDALSKGDSRSVTWGKLPGQRAFREVVCTAASFYYAHPLAWDEIGWGGPKYPEIYVRIGCGKKDPEEAGEVGHIREQG